MFSYTIVRASMPPIREELAKIRVKPQRKEPLWKGPEIDGITYSLLSRWLVCRERFRLLVVDGLKPKPSFDHKMEFGNMWHQCHETLITATRKNGVPIGATDWPQKLKDYAMGLIICYPYQQEDIDKWYRIAKIAFGIYQKQLALNAKKYPPRLPLFAEKLIDVNYKLPSGRLVRIRGKIDGGYKRDEGLWIEEHKTSSRINEERVEKRLRFDLQTMLYLVAVKELQRIGDPTFDTDIRSLPIKGVIYNVVKRPAQYQGKRETKEEFFTRLEGIIAEDPDEFFSRWDVGISVQDINHFRNTCLDPMLEHLCWWWDVTVGKANVSIPAIQYLLASLNWRHPYGVYNILDEGGSSDLDFYLETGNDSGLYHTNNLYPELSEVKS